MISRTPKPPSESIRPRSGCIGHWKGLATLAMAALAFLAVLAAMENAAHPAPILPHDPDQSPPADCGTIALTVPEAQRLFHLYTTLARDLPPRTEGTQLASHLRWSDWRRRHQARARWHHSETASHSSHNTASEGSL